MKNLVVMAFVALFLGFGLAACGTTPVDEPPVVSEP